MCSRAISTSPKRSGVVKDSYGQQDNLRDVTDNDKSKMDVGSGSEDDSVDDLIERVAKTHPGGKVVKEMYHREDDKTGGDEDDGGGSSMDEEEEQFEDGMSDNSDESENEDESWTIEDGDGVDFSDGDDNDLEADDINQTAKDGENSDVRVAANPAWAQAMAKILRTQKPPGKKTVTLSKARTIQAAECAAAQKEAEPEFEIVGGGEQKAQIKCDDVKPSAEELLQAKRERLAHCRVKQKDFDYNRERALTKIATKGVVQLFNAVRSQQKNLGSKLAEAHSTRMEEKLLKSIDKNSFLEHLTGRIRSRPIEEVAKAIKKEEGEIVLPKSWDELNKNLESSSWNEVIQIKDEPED